MRLAILVMAVVTVALSGCGNPATTKRIVEHYSEDEADAVSVTALEGERAGETYEEYDERRNSYAGGMGTFGDYGCTVDCSGHEAGYEWADDNDINDPDDCGGNNWSFIEGCQAYAEEQEEAEEQADFDEQE